MSLNVKTRKSSILNQYATLVEYSCFTLTGDTVNTKELIDEVVSLPVEERAAVADSLLQSLNQPETEIDKEWAIVAQKRLSELRAGTVKAVSGEQVFERIKQRFDQ